MFTRLLWISKERAQVERKLYARAPCLSWFIGYEADEKGDRCLPQALTSPSHFDLDNFIWLASSLRNLKQ